MTRAFLDLHIRPDPGPANHDRHRPCQPLAVAYSSITSVSESFFWTSTSLCSRPLATTTSFFGLKPALHLIIGPLVTISPFFLLVEQTLDAVCRIISFNPSRHLLLLVLYASVVVCRPISTSNILDVVQSRKGSRYELASILYTEDCRQLAYSISQKSHFAV